MKTKILYVLTSDSTDPYLEQAIASIYSLRLHTPDAYVMLAVDETTKATLVGTRSNIINYISQLIAIKCPEHYNKMQTSRFLKTSIREYIEGDYLFVDTDTIICKDLSCIDMQQAEIAAVLDFHGDEYVDDELLWDNNNIQLMNWPECASSKRYNSGVFYVKDTLRTHQFYDRWHSYWKDCQKKGVNIDQLSLRKANRELNLIAEMDGVWNCQLVTNRSDKFYSDAIIMHYYNKTIDKFYFNQELVYYKIKAIGDLPNDIKESIANPYATFSQKSRVISGKDIDYIKSDIYFCFNNYPKFYLFLNYLSRAYKDIIRFCCNVKDRMLR